MKKVASVVKQPSIMEFSFKVGREGFEPPKALPIDLQSTPFGHSGISPYARAGCQIRTDDPEITNHVLWPTELIRLVYFSVFSERLLFQTAAQSKELIFYSASLFFNFYFRFQEKKVGKLPASHRSTTYPCCLPTLGGFSRSWSHRTYPGTKVDKF